MQDSDRLARVPGNRGEGARRLEGSLSRLPRAAVDASVGDVHLFGIRHHGPGSARSLVHALEQVRPDVVLIEGPPDANELLRSRRIAQFEPPVALLVYMPQTPRAAVLYPFAQIFAGVAGDPLRARTPLPVRFIDLPQSLRDPARERSDGQATKPSEARRRSAALAAIRWRRWRCAAGYSDTERWWDHLVESRAGHDIEVFKAIHEMMSACAPSSPSRCRSRSSSAKRTCASASVRRAPKGFEHIAVVCGAWHTPALAQMPSAKADDALLKGAAARRKPRRRGCRGRTSALSYRSGYGAGVESPVWYELLWNSAMRWARSG